MFAIEIFDILLFVAKSRKDAVSELTIEAVVELIEESAGGPSTLHSNEKTLPNKQQMLAQGATNQQVQSVAQPKTVNQKQPNQQLQSTKQQPADSWWKDQSHVAQVDKRKQPMLNEPVTTSGPAYSLARDHIQKKYVFSAEAGTNKNTNPGQNKELAEIDQRAWKSREKSRAVEEDGKLGKPQPQTKSPVPNRNLLPGQNDQDWETEEEEEDSDEVGDPEEEHADDDEMEEVEQQVSSDEDEGYDNYHSQKMKPSFKNAKDWFKGRPEEEGRSDAVVNDRNYDPYNDAQQETEEFNLDPLKEEEIRKLMDDNADLLEKAVFNRPKRRVIQQGLRLIDNPTRKHLKQLMMQILTAEPTADEKQKKKAKMDRWHEKTKAKIDSHNKWKNQDRKEQNKFKMMDKLKNQAVNDFEDDYKPYPAHKKKAPHHYQQNKVSIKPSQHSEESCEPEATPKTKTRKPAGETPNLLEADARHLRLDDLKDKTFQFYYINHASNWKNVETIFKKLSKKEVVSIDVHHERSKGVPSGNYLCLSSNTKAYIFNLHNLNDNPDFYAIVHKLLSNQSLTKIGYCAKQDLEALENTFLSLGNLQGCSSLSIEDELFISKTSTMLNLSNMCFRMYGKTLNPEKLKKLIEQKDLKTYEERKAIVIESVALLSLYLEIAHFTADEVKPNKELLRGIKVDETWTFMLDYTCPCGQAVLESNKLRYQVLKLMTYKGSLA